MSLTGKDWWVWDADGLYWRAIRSGRTSEPVIIDPDPDPDPDDPFPDPSGRQVLLVTESGTLGAGNQALHDILVGDGWTVTVRSLSDPEDYQDVSVLVMSAGNPEQDTGQYLFPPVGVVAVDSWRRFGMGEALQYATTPLDVTVVDTSSPLAAGYSGTFPAYLAEAWITWKPETDGALQTVVTRAGQPTERVVFAYEAGAQMPGRYATTRHVGLGYHQDGFAAGLSVQARAQFLASVRWARDTTVAPLPVPAAPAGLSAAPGDGRVRLSWNAPAYAETYVVRRGTVTGGPYTDLASGVTSTTYTDSTAVNDTAYFFVVAARNSTGEGPDSAEVTATPTVSSTENLSLLVSTAEIAMWQDRKVNGPFRVSSDFSSNSPGHWAEMVSDSTANWSAARWTGPPELYDHFHPTNPDTRGPHGAVKKLGHTSSQTANDPPTATQRMAHSLLGAAYVAATDGNATLAQQITDEIRWYSEQSRLNFNSRTLYPDGHFNDQNPLFMIALWAMPLAVAYDACRSLLPADSEVEYWFLGLAGACHGNLGSLNNLFPNRGTDSYASRVSWVDETHTPLSRLANGNIVEHLRVSRWYNNRRTDMAAFQGFAGLLADNSFHIGWAKRYAREVVMFANRTTANQWTNGDNNRGSSTFPSGGFMYDLGSFMRLMTFMEALARTGDTSLYDFSSSEGSAAPTWGSNHLKTMKEIIGQRVETVAQTIDAQYRSSGTPPPLSIAGNETYRIKSRHTGTNQEIVMDGILICAAAYYNEPDWVDVVNRVGTPTGFTSSPQNMGATTGWRIDYRSRFLRSISSSPIGSA